MRSSPEAVVKQNLRKRLKRQRGKCPHCGLRDGNVLEVHHRNGDENDSRYEKLLLRHAHCHDEVHSQELALIGIYDKGLVADEPDEIEKPALSGTEGSQVRF